MSLSTELFSEKLLHPKSKGAAGRSARNVCRHKSGSAAINRFFKKRFHWITAGEKGGGVGGPDVRGRRGSSD